MSTLPDNKSALFSTFIMSLASATLIEMGLVEDPVSKAKNKNREAASQHLDLLSMFLEKTKGNLDADEQALLARVLTDLKLQFVKVFEESKST